MKRFCFLLASIATAVLLLIGIGYYLFADHEINVVYDKIKMRNDVWIEVLERGKRAELTMTYPIKVGKYDLTEFYKELFERHFSGSRLLYNGEEVLKKEAENLDFKEAARKIVQEVGVDGYSMNINCYYDKLRKWLQVDVTEITCLTAHCYYEETFFYSLEKQRVLEFDDFFLPEKQDNLMKLIKERIMDNHRLNPGGLLTKDWKPAINDYNLTTQDSIVCWQFDCVTDPDIDLPFVYYPLRVTIAEKGIKEYLAYPIPEE